MIDVVFSIHDLDGKYNTVLGVAVYSLLLHTKADVRIHIIHDETVNQHIQNRLSLIVSKFNQHIKFYMVDVSSWNISEDVYKVSTIGTMLRLVIPELFVNYDKILYLDADIIVNLDISELWKNDITEYYVGACRDKILGHMTDGSPIIRDGIVKGEDYFNAGVLLMNLKKIRELGDFFQICTDFFKSDQECRFADQDVMNAVFCGHVLYLDEKYNYFTIDIRRTGDVLGDVIYHFAGDKASFSEMRKCDKLYYTYLLCTPDVNETVLESIKDKVATVEHGIKLYQKLVKDIESNKRAIIWGATGILRERLCNIISIKRIDYIVDSNQELWGKEINAIKICSPQVVYHEKKSSFIIIVASLRYYNDISKDLIDHGMEENIDFMDGRLLLLEKQGGYAN